MNQEITIDKLFDLSGTIAADYLSGFTYPWEALKGISEEIVRLGLSLGDDYTEIAPQVWVSNSATIAPTAYINGPCIVGPHAEVRHCAYIRGAALIGAGAVVGNSCELKNCILFDKVQVPHYNYVGDSILGIGAHMGAGAVTSNIKSDRKNIMVQGPDGRQETGMRKIGAILGDGVEIGCGSVLNPGTIIGKGSRVYPLSSVRGYVPAHHIYKNPMVIVPIQ